MLKKIFDISFVLIFFPIWVQFFLIIIFTSLIFNGLPIFFVQYRGGFKNKKIKIIKFRTMDSNQNINAYSNFLRSSKLDEIPQLLNVLKGDLSLVGPRPLHYEYKKLYKKEHLKRFEVMPGITGWSQIKSNENMKWSEKFTFDLWYVENQSLLLDIKIIFITLFKMSLTIFRKNKKVLIAEKFNGSN